MAETRESLASAIRTFTAVLERCLAETTFAEDRRLYAGDLVTANEWLTKLEAGGDATAIATEIAGSATAKQFTDYWRQGVWGEIESAALSALQETMRGQLGS